MKKRIPLIVTIIVLLGFGVSYIYIPKTYSIYNEAIELAKKDEKVISVLGDEIEDGLFAYSKIYHGNAKIEIPVSGNKGEGELLVYGHKVENKWVLKNVYFLTPGSKKRQVVFGE